MVVVDVVINLVESVFTVDVVVAVISMKLVEFQFELKLELNIGILQICLQAKCWGKIPPTPNGYTPDRVLIHLGTPVSFWDTIYILKDTPGKCITSWITQWLPQCITPWITQWIPQYVTS